jgi:SAM-dependent methyltransferase
LEGHYSDILCSYRFKEVVSIDLSEPHIARAKYLLHEVRKYNNSTVLLGNVLDQKFMSTLGKFDLVFFHGLLYHLTSPVMIFENIENLINNNDQFYLLLSHQFHMNYGNMLQPLPVAEIKSRHLKPDDKLGSKFERVSMRLNVAGLHLILESYGYEGMIAYDAPVNKKRKHRRRDIQIVISKVKNKSFLEKLNSENPFPKFKFYLWKGESITNHIIKFNPIRFCYKLLNRLSTEFGK